MGTERAKRVLRQLDPLIRLDDGPRVIHLSVEREVGELCNHATGYHTDPYGILFRTDVRVAELVDLTGWEIAEQIPEVAALLERTEKMIKEWTGEPW